MHYVGLHRSYTMVSMAKFDNSQQPTHPSADTRQFLKHFKGHTTLVTLSKTSVERKYTDLNQDAFKLIDQSNRLGHNVYFTVNETGPTGRTAHDIESIRAIFCDDDIPRPKPRNTFPINPSIIVRSSGVPGKYKFQYYWLTTTSNVKQWESVEHRLIQDYGMDKAVHDLARIMRLPGYVNNKYDPAQASCMVSQQGTVYTWEAILKAFPPVSIQAVYKAESKDTDGQFNEHKLYIAFQNGESPGDISGSLNSLISHWGHHYSMNKMLKKIDQLYGTISPEVMEKHKARYFAARAQVPKWCKSIKTKIATERAIKTQAPVVTIHSEVPRSLEWDWGILKSNPIPEESIPPTMLAAAKEVGEWAAVGQDPAILSAVFITSSLLSKNVLIHEIGDDLTTHCQSGICIVMDTGARKSAIYEKMNKPFFDYEIQLQKEWEDKKFVTESLVKAIDSEISALDKEYNKHKGPGPKEREHYAINRGQKLLDKSALQINKPWLRSSDLTEEKLIRKLQDNNECIAAISDDARPIINNILGKYGKEGTTGEAVYINALTGSSILYERVGSDEEIDIKNPVLNALLFVQPDSALRLRNSDMFVPSGLAARLPMYFYPVSGVDIVKNTQRRRINEDLMTAYYDALRRLCFKRHKNPMHIRLDKNGMNACIKMDHKFAGLLQKEWRGQYDKSNKLITLTIMYATCFAALDDPKFGSMYKNPSTEEGKDNYVLSVKYLNMGFMFSSSLFGHSISSHRLISYEALPRKAESVISTLRKWYASGKIEEGFVQCSMLYNSFGINLREFLPEIFDMLLEKKWLFTTLMMDERRKLNGGFPDKLVSKGDIIYHLNLEGVSRREEMGLDILEQGILE